MSDSSAKERALAAIRSLPEDASFEDAIEALCLVAKIEEGVTQSDAGELTPHEEVKKQFAR